MVRILRRSSLSLLLAGVVVVGLGLRSTSAESRRPSAEQPTGDVVELFAAIEAEQVEVQLIPKDVRQAMVMVKNRTKRPLSIKMPAAFAGVPVLAQNNNNNNNRGGGGGGGNQNQGFGGGMGMGMGGMGMGGFFNVAPDKVGKIKVATVCLEHGKEDPNPRVAYEMRPIESFTDKSELIEVCSMLGRGEIDQVSAQAAAWHLSDGLTWQELAEKVKVRHLNGSVELYFSPAQIQQAVKIVQVAVQRSEAAPESTVVSPGDSLSQK